MIDVSFAGNRYTSPGDHPGTNVLARETNSSACETNFPACETDYFAQETNFSERAKHFENGWCGGTPTLITPDPANVPRAWGH
jgi:hypothetical protein